MLLIRVSIVLSLVRVKSPRTEWVFTVIIVEEKKSHLAALLQLSLYGRTLFYYLPHLFTGDNFTPLF